MLLRVGEVATLLGLSRSTIWRMSKRRDFPSPVRLIEGPTGPVGWHREEVEEWVESRSRVIGKE